MGLSELFPDGVYVADSEFYAPSGERSEPICFVFRELLSGKTIRLWQEELRARSEPPFPIGPNSVFVVYYGTAELGCFQALGWPMPARILDLYAEFKCATSGQSVPHGHGLLGALAYYGLNAIDAVEKEEMRALAIRGGPYTDKESQALLDYCESDVVALTKLLRAMLPMLDLPRALLRGRYMAAAARMEWAGTPIDVPMLNRIRKHWPAIQTRLIANVDAEYGVYEGRTFKVNRFEAYLAKRNIPWPQLDSGRLALDDDTFKERTSAFPELSALRELRKTLAELRMESMAVGKDGRNRCLLSVFRSKTGRNQPSNSKFIFGQPAWFRSLIKPAPGRALAYIDFEQQEFGIAAALSGDPAMLEAYQSGDAYLAFAKQAGAVPKDATKDSHKAERKCFKECVLAVQYGMGARSLGLRINRPEIEAGELLRQHRAIYPTFWKWSQAAVDHAMLHNYLYSAFGWLVHVGIDPNPRSLQNFPMQANGAEMLRLACCLATERGITICAPVHDAVLIEAPIEKIDESIVGMQRAMAEASELVLDGFRLRSGVEAIIRYPDRYMDEDRGRPMWNIVQGILAELD